MISSTTVQVNICQKLSFLPQLTHNMTTDCSLNNKFNTLKLLNSSEHVENMLYTEIVFDIQNNFCTQHVLPMFCKKNSFWQRFTCNWNMLFWRFQYFLISSHLYLRALEMKKTTILILKRVFEIFLEEVGPWLPLGASRNGKGIIPRLQLLVFLFYVTSGIPFRHLAVASGKFII